MPHSVFICATPHTNANATRSYVVGRTATVATNCPTASLGALVCLSSNLVTFALLKMRVIITQRDF